MSMEELEKLIKILGYTASSNDNEALNACRRANTLMKSMNLSWEQIIKDKTIVVNEIISNDKSSIAASTSNQSSGRVNTEIEMMLSVLMSRTNFSRLNNTGREFIRSINDFYHRNGRLTDKQLEALRRWYNNV